MWLRATLCGVVLLGIGCGGTPEDSTTKEDREATKDEREAQGYARIGMGAWSNPGSGGLFGYPVTSMGYKPGGSGSSSGGHSGNGGRSGGNSTAYKCMSWGQTTSQVCGSGWTAVHTRPNAATCNGGTEVTCHKASGSGVPRYHYGSSCPAGMDQIGPAEQNSSGHWYVQCV